MDNNPDYNSLLRMAQSPEGKILMEMLRNADSDSLNRIISAASAGDMAGAKQMLSQLLRSQQAQTLLKKLEEQL